MKLEETEKLLTAAKDRHFTPDELYSYLRQTLDAAAAARADAHLGRCLRCKRDLEIYRQESARPENREVTADDVALVRRLRQEQASLSQPSTSANQVSLRDRFTDYLHQLLERWRSDFLTLEALPTHRAGGDEVIWEGESNDGRMKAYATIEKNNSVKIHFSSDDPELKGMSFKVELGMMSRVITLELRSDSKVYAEVEATQKQLPINMSVIKIEPVF